MQEPYQCPKCGHVHTQRVGRRNDYGEYGSACPSCEYVYEVPEENRTEAGNMARAFVANPVIINPSASTDPAYPLPRTAKVPGTYPQTTDDRHSFPASSGRPKAPIG